MEKMLLQESYQEISHDNDIIDNKYEEFNVGGLFIRKPL